MAASAPAAQLYTLTASDPAWPVPATGNYNIVTLGPGGGGMHNVGGSLGGGGGGSGDIGVTTTPVALTLGMTLNITVPAGGAEMNAGAGYTTVEETGLGQIAWAGYGGGSADENGGLPKGDYGPDGVSGNPGEAGGASAGGNGGTVPELGFSVEGITIPAFPGGTGGDGANNGGNAAGYGAGGGGGGIDSSAGGTGAGGKVWIYGPLP